MKAHERHGIRLGFSMGSGGQLPKDIGSLVASHDRYIEVIGSIGATNAIMEETIGSIEDPHGFTKETPSRKARRNKCRKQILKQI